MDTLVLTCPTKEVRKSHLNFVDGLPRLQILAPHRDTPLVVVHTPALLAQTLHLEAGECSVIRDAHSMSRHGSSLGVRERKRER